MNKLLPWLAGAVALGGTQSFAQTAASLHPIVVSAARVEQSLSDVIPSVSVISRQDIERSGAPTLIDLLQGEAGVEVGSDFYRWRACASGSDWHDQVGRYSVEHD